MHFRSHFLGRQRQSARSILSAALFVVALLALASCVSSPSASFTATPNPTTPGSEVRFDASASTGNIARYQWDFGDGTTRTTTTPTTQHSYEFPGRYEAELFVQAEGSGAGRTTRNIVVTNPDQPDAPLGFYAIRFTNPGLPAIASIDPIQPQGPVEAQVLDGPVASADITLEVSGAQKAFTLGGETVYLSVDFLLTNNSSQPLRNPTLLAYGRAEFREGTAYSEPLSYADAPVVPSALQTLKPANSLLIVDQTLIGNAHLADLVAFSETDSDFVTLTEQLQTAFSFVETVFPYGFAIHAGEVGKVIPAGGTGTVTLAFRYSFADTIDESIESFTWNAVLVEDDMARVTQTPDERSPLGWRATLERARFLGAERIVAIGSGARDTPQRICDSVIGLTNVRIAGQNRDDPLYNALLDTDGSPQFRGCP